MKTKVALPAKHAETQPCSTLTQTSHLNQSHAPVHQQKSAAENSPQSIQLKALQAMMNASSHAVQKQAMLQRMETRTHGVAQRASADKANQTGLPVQLKNGIEALSGISLDHVQVHYNSAQPAQLHAHAYAQGNQIHIAPGQEKHLPHEAWHVVQQAQGRVKPTMQMKTGVPVNDDESLESEADIMGAKALTIPLQKQRIDNTPAALHSDGLIQRYDSDDEYDEDGYDEDEDEELANAYAPPKAPTLWDHIPPGLQAVFLRAEADAKAAAQAKAEAEALAQEAAARAAAEAEEQARIAAELEAAEMARLAAEAEAAAQAAFEAAEQAKAAQELEAAQQAAAQAAASSSSAKKVAVVAKKRGRARGIDITAMAFAENPFSMKEPELWAKHAAKYAYAGAYKSYDTTFDPGGRYSTKHFLSADGYPALEVHVHRHANGNATNGVKVVLSEAAGRGTVEGYAGHHIGSGALAGLGIPFNAPKRDHNN